MCRFCRMRLRMISASLRLETARSSFVHMRSISKRGLAHPKDSRFHLGLLPQPWLGDPSSASVFILLLNPGLNPVDYYSEFRVATYRKALLDNLRLRSGREFPLLFLDPELSWHSGARYCRDRLHWLVLELCRQTTIGYRGALSLVAQRVCFLQLVPYHSAAYRLSSRLQNRLLSTQLVRAFVHDHLVHRVDILILVARQTAQWAVPPSASAIIFVGSARRGARFPRNSRAGQALLRHFGLSAG